MFLYHPNTGDPGEGSIITQGSGGINSTDSRQRQFVGGNCDSTTVDPMIFNDCITGLGRTSYFSQ